MLGVAAASAISRSLAQLKLVPDARKSNQVVAADTFDQCYNLLDTNLHLSIAMQMKL